jgi:glucose-6-phosphate 1-dehydrogenase
MQITMVEDFGVQGRDSFYDQTGLPAMPHRSTLR